MIHVSDRVVAPMVTDGLSPAVMAVDSIKTLEMARLSQGAQQTRVAHDQNQERNKQRQHSPEHFVCQQQLRPVTKYCTNLLHVPATCTHSQVAVEITAVIIITLS